MMLSLTACDKKEGRNTKNKSDVEQILEDAKTEDMTTEITTEVTTELQVNTTEELVATITDLYTTEYSDYTSWGHGDEDEKPLGEADPNVDIDLTVLTANMVYAEVYNMMMNPDEYLGKTIKVSGPYFPLYYDVMDNYYHYVMIEDALACCENGMEFIWDEGSHVYPDEYPKEDDMIEISGELKCYEEEGYIYYYLDIDEYTLLESE